MHIVIILEYFYNLGRPIGGAERQVARLAEKFIEKGGDVTLLAGQWQWGEPRHEIINHIPVHRIFSFWGMFNLKGLRKFGYYAYLFNLFIYLFVHRKSYQIIHSHSAMPSAFVAALAGRFFGKKTLARPMASGQPWGDISRMVNQSSVYGSRWMLKQFPYIDCMIALNQEVIQELESIGVARHKIVQMPNGVVTTGITPKTTYQLTDNQVNLVFVGRLDSQKGIETLLNALKQVIEAEPSFQWQLRILGKGDLRAHLELQVKQLALINQVQFLGQVPDVFSILYQSDLFILPSRAEGMSNALLEGMTVGLPCIASNIPANAQVIQHNQNGLLFTVDDVDNLTQTIICLAKDQSLREHLGREATRTIIQHYSIDHIAERFMAIYQKLLQSTSGLSLN